jgi:hypothetical protein
MFEKKDAPIEKSKLLGNIADIVTIDNISKYVLGTKKTGQPRAIYDIIVDIKTNKFNPKKKKKNKKTSSFEYYPIMLKSKKKKKGKKKRDKFKY